MNDDLEPRVRGYFRNVALPPAPNALRQYLVNLPNDIRPSRPPWQGRWRYVAIVATTFVVLVLAAGSVLVPSSAPQSTNPIATLPIVTIKPGLRTFTAPGVAFEYPTDWADQSSKVNTPFGPRGRSIALLTGGLPICSSPPSGETAPPNACYPIAAQPGSFRLQVIESFGQLPGARYRGKSVTIAGYPGWQEPVSSVSGQPTSLQWTVLSPDRGAYAFSAEFPLADLALRQAELDELLSSLRLSVWQPPLPVHDGLAHLDLGNFSLDFPVGWVVYFPRDMSMMDQAVVTVSSSPVLPPCAGQICQRFTTPPGTIVIEFREGGGSQAPDWSKATASVGGQPAFHYDWGPDNATGADEGHGWSASLGGRAALSIDVSLRGPDLPELRTEMDRVLASVRIVPTPLATP